MTSSLDDVMSVKAFVRRYPDLDQTEKAVRWDIYNAAHNGLAEYGAVIRKGRRTFLVVPKYRDWLFGRGGAK